MEEDAMTEWNDPVMKAAYYERFGGSYKHDSVPDEYHAGWEDALAAVPAPTEADTKLREVLARSIDNWDERLVRKYNEAAYKYMAEMAKFLHRTLIPAPKTQDGEAREALAVVKQTVWHKDQFYVTIDTDSEECVTISEELLVKLMTESGWVLVPSEPATPVFEAMGLPPVPPFPSIHPEGGEAK